MRELPSVDRRSSAAGQRTPDPKRGILRFRPILGGRHFRKSVLTRVTGQSTLCLMIKTFADKRTQQLFVTGTAKRFPPDIARRAIRKLEYVDLATRLDDLKVPPGNRLHALGKKRKGQHSISINDQWRICFRFVDGDAYDVEITDYH